jgi:UDP-N-acetylmuramate: L-alanyl-gamma-D-glutamyl-meso-diaminopimelate ligase
MLKDLGYEVTGSDQNVYPPISRFLEEKGIFVSKGFSGQNLLYGPDLVVVGNAVTRNNPEAEKLREIGLHFCSMPQAINHFVASGKETLLITGTHGKTTTAALCAWILQTAGSDPSFLIGGILNNFNSNYRLGTGAQMVIEGDEYDTAFFAKVPKFVYFRPSQAVLTSVEFDHADIYADKEHVVQVFRDFIEALPADSPLYVCDADKTIDSLTELKKGECMRYGTLPDSPWRLGNVEIEPPWTRFEISREGKLFGRFRTRIFGKHNLLNATAAVAMADRLGISTQSIAEALETFRGVKRRQEVRGEKRGIIVMDDFAHHPTAVRETIKAVKGFYRKNRLIAVFEPRTHASMRKVFQDIYPQSFEQADLVLIRHPSMLHKVPENDRFSSEKLVQDLRRGGKEAHFFPDTDSIIQYLLKEATTGDLILIMSNGGFDNIHERLLKAF